jgi:2'-hydroxyisoflavone reductase
MQLLIIGGTRFLGRAIVDAAIAAGHTVTLFNRGQSNPDLYPGLEQITGDRDGGLAALDGRSWDAVIDTCGYVPRLVEASARYLAPAVDHYTFISTISVYADPAEMGITEESELGRMADPQTEEVTGETYGPLKVLCEEAAIKAMGGRALLVRSGLIVGPHDPTDRFSYWPHRVAQGGEVLAPGEPGAPVQFIDVRDIAAWVVMATEQQLTGPYNVTGPDQPLTMGGLLAACRAETGSGAELTWVDEAFLLSHEIEPFVEMPFWLPADSAGILAVDTSKARAAGLRCRPLPETIAATLAWLRTRPDDHVWRAGISAEREAALLADWAART